MSLIHDSLRKLETKQVKNIASGFSSAEGSYHKSTSAKKLWIIIAIVIGVVLVYYAYTLLNRYQKQNELLLNDIKQMKSNVVVKNNTNESLKAKPIKKVIVQQPVAIPKSTEVNLVASQERQKEVSELNRKLLSVESQAPEVAVVMAKPIQSETKTSTNNQRMLERNKTVAVKPVNKKPSTKKNIFKKKKTHQKLTVKQTRQLVNNLQMQMELGNTDEVNALLAKLAQSSGEESLVYLRMKAYWSNMNDDKSTAVVMYKKILFQKPYDIQAGTNLALIEAKNNQKPQALKRLELLKNKYPSNKIIIDYFNRVEAN